MPAPAIETWGCGMGDLDALGIGGAGGSAYSSGVRRDNTMVVHGRQDE